MEGRQARSAGSLGGETPGVDDWPKAASSNQPTRSGPDDQADRGKGWGGNALALRSPPKTEVGSRRCARADRGVAWHVCVATDQLVATLGSALTRHLLTPMASVASSTTGTEREAAAAKPKRTREWPGGVNRNSEKQGGGIPTPRADRDDRRSAQQPRAVTTLREAAGAVKVLCLVLVISDNA
jgi:hypothetical protein